MKAIIYILGAVALAVIAFIIYLMISKNKTAKEAIAATVGAVSTNGTGYTGANTVPSGTTITTSGGGIATVIISELLQKLLSGMPFSDDEKILSGTVPAVIVKNKSLFSASFGQFIVWDKDTIGGKIRGVGTTGAAGTNTMPVADKDPEELIQGVKRKNLIWQLTNEAPNRPYSAGDMISMVRMHCRFYYIENVEKVYPLPVELIDDYRGDISQWKYVSKPETQIKINTYNSTH